jgi:hypothetical protein
MPKIVCNALDCEYNTDGTCDCNLIRLNDAQVCQKYIEKTPTDHINFNDREQLQKHYQHWLQVNGFPDSGVNAFAFLNLGHMFYTEKVKDYLAANSNVLLD